MAMRRPLSSRPPVVNSPHCTLACAGIVAPLRVLPFTSVACTSTIRRVSRVRASLFVTCVTSFAQLAVNV